VRGILTILLSAVLIATPAFAKGRTHSKIHWMTTQNVSQTGTAAAAAVAVSPDDDSTISCANTSIPMAAPQMPVVVALSTNPVTTNPFDALYAGSVLLANTTPNCLTFHVVAYVGDPTGCTDFASCSPLMTKLSGIFDNNICGGGQAPVPYTFSQTSVPASNTARFYIAVTIDDNGFAGSTGTCVYNAGHSEEHDHVGP
jgi:hypothetical protein